MTNVEMLYQRIDRGREGKNIGLKTVIPKIDEYTGGIQPVYTLTTNQCWKKRMMQPQ